MFNSRFTAAQTNKLMHVLAENRTTSALEILDLYYHFAYIDNPEYACVDFSKPSSFKYLAQIIAEAPELETIKLAQMPKSEVKIKIEMVCAVANDDGSVSPGRVTIFAS